MKLAMGWAPAIAWMAALVSNPAAAAACEKPFSEVFQEASPSVVRVFSVAIDPFSLVERVHTGVGAGIVVDDAGHIVTNAHIVFRASEIMISTKDNDMRPAALVGVDPISDLAVIKPADEGAPLPKARLGNSAHVLIGDEVLAIGYPYGVGKTATRGIVSGLERVIPLSPSSWLTPLIQTDAAINPGNSGGPLVNRCGDVIAINSLFRPTGQNVNFAIPIDLVRELLPQFIEKGRVIRPWHGIHGQLVPPPLLIIGVPIGLLVETIEPGSPAQRIGLRGGTLPISVGMEEFLFGGDVITKVNGEALTDRETIVRIARGLKVGDTIQFEFWRSGAIFRAEATLPERPILPGDLRRAGTGE